MFRTTQSISLRALLIALILMVFVRDAIGQSAKEDWQDLTNRTISLYAASRFKEAETTAMAAIRIAEQQMADQFSELGSSYNNLGAIKFNLGEFQAAREWHLKALNARQQMPAPNPAEIATSLESIAEAASRAGNLRDAAAFYRRAVRAYEDLGQDTFFVKRGLAYALFQLSDRTAEEDTEAYLSLSQSLTLWGDRKAGNETAYISDLINAIQLGSAIDRNAEVINLAQELVVLQLAQEPQDKAELGWAYRYLATALRDDGDLNGAEQAYRSAIKHMARIDGGINRHVSELSFYLGDVLEDLDRSEEAARAFRRTLEIEREIYGDTHEETLGTYNRLGLLLYRDGRYAASEQLLQKGLHISETLFGPEAAWTATVADNLGLVLSAQGKASRAISMHKRALAIRDRVYGRMDPTTSKTINNLAMALRDQGEHAEALDLFREALDIDRQTLAPGSWEIGVALEMVADGLAMESSPASLMEAFGHYQEALRISRNNYLPQSPRIAHLLDSLALMATRVSLHDAAARYFREATEIYSAAQNQAKLTENAEVFDAAAVNLLALGNTHAEDAFEISQWPLQSAASKAIAASATRVAAGDPELGGLVRRLQDLTTRHAELDNRALLALGGNDPTRSEQFRKSVAEVEQEIASAQSALNEQFPDYSQFQGGQPASLHEVADALQPGEALVFLRPGHIRETGDRMPGLLFLVTSKKELTAVELEAGYTLQQDAQTLLCSVKVGMKGCDAPAATDPLTRGAFDIDNQELAGTSADGYNLPLAYDMYRRTLGKVAPKLEGIERLIIVPGDETLAALPFQMLLTSPAPPTTSGEAAAYREAEWLIRKWAITVLPNVSALTHFRRRPAETNASSEETYLGIGDPVIGHDTTFDCDQFNAFEVAGLDRAVQTNQVAALWSGSNEIANVEAVRALTRLPDTRCELQRIADSFGGGHLLMQDAATEAEVKRLSQSGTLGGYSVISFATHGLIAGEVDNAEPALVLTPPEIGSNQDDGLLTASEIASLKLNADWVLLSACNTAAGQVRARDGSVQSESFSGLARAFFHAGARNLMVSHWPVSSPAAVRLTTATFDALAQDASLSRATAFQSAMLAILDHPESTKEMLHPRYWAPFTLLGNGI